MECNVGTTERAIRLILGAALIITAAVVPMATSATVLAGAAGAIAILTGMVGFCPLWKAAGINTCGTAGKSTTRPA
jgi:hypothetical protein